jgi:hypothetical protein
LRWSPDGSRVAYRIAGSEASDPKTHNNIVIVSAEAGEAVTVPVFASEGGGTFVDGMRFVEEAGWHSNSEIFAFGSANPTSLNTESSMSLPRKLPLVILVSISPRASAQESRLRS